MGMVGLCGCVGVWVMVEWAVGQWIVGVTSFQKIFGLCGLKCHIMEIWRDVTLDDTRTTECEDRARILETEFAIFDCWLGLKPRLCQNEKFH